MSDRKIKKEMQEEAQEQRRKEVAAALKSLNENHSSRAVTRRDLLGAGVYTFAASLTLPTLGTLLAPSQAFAQARNCPVPGAGGQLASFVTLNLAGGAGLCGNYVATDAGGQLLPSYSRMGMGDNQLNIETEFGNVPFAGDDGTGVLISKILSELRAVTSQTTRDNTAFIAIPCRSRDDFSMNPFDASGLIAKAGLIGTDLPNLGRSATSTGIRQMYAKVKPPTPLRVGRYEDIQSSLQFSGGILDNYTEEQKTSLVKLVGNLSEEQTKKISSNAGGRMLANLVGCAVDKNNELASKPPETLDIRQDATLAGIWGVAGNTGSNDQNVVFGSMVNAGLKGKAGTVALERGGYDYHNNNRQNVTDVRDQQAGAVMGRVLETAAALGKKVFLYVTSDGAVGTRDTTARNTDWSSDRGSAGMAFILAYDPAGRPQTSGHQIGQFTAAQAADDDFVTGSNPELVASAVVLNYLKFNNRMDLEIPVLGSTFTEKERELVLKFG